MEKYHASMERVGRRLNSLLAQTLDLAPTFFDDKFDEPMLALRLLHYSSALSEVERGIYACGEHSDYGMLTLLATGKLESVRRARTHTSARFIRTKFSEPPVTPRHL